jgi:hypothetical protein
MRTALRPEESQERDTIASPPETVSPSLTVQYYLVGVSANRDSESSGQTEIRQFNYSVTVNQEVLRLEVPVQDSVGMTKLHATEKLSQNILKRKISDKEK